MREAVIETQLSRGRQSVTVEKTLTLEAYKVRLTVKSDAYDFQSLARADVWNPVELRWNQVCRIPWSLMKTPHKLVHCQFPSEKDLLGEFQEDLTDLLVSAKKILF